MGAESVIKNSQEIIPPTKDAVIPNPRALPGFPARAMGNPSIVVIIDAGVPGILKSVAVIKPPLTAPTYMLINKMKAKMGSMLKVSGSVRAISMAPVRPGIAPIVMPSTVPNTIKAIP